MKEVIILGSGPSRVACPWNAEVWAVNNAYKQWKTEGKRPNKTFLVHKQVRYPNGDPMFDWADMNAWADEVISLWEIEGLKATPYPYERIFAFSKYMTNTICYMLAYAIDQKYDKVFFYGVDMQEGGEYYLEKAGLEFWIGVAMGRGMDVHIAPGGSLLRTPVGVPYGTIDDYDAEVKSGRKVLMKMGLLNNLMGIESGVDKKYVRRIWG